MSVRRTATALAVVGSILAGGGASASAEEGANTVDDVADVGYWSSSSGITTIDVAVTCQAGVSAWLEVEAYPRSKNRQGTYVIEPFTCTGAPQVVAVTYDDPAYPTLKPGPAEIYVSLNGNFGSDRLPEDFYGEQVHIRGAP